MTYIVWSLILSTVMSALMSLNALTVVSFKTLNSWPSPLVAPGDFETEKTNNENFRTSTITLSIMN